MIRTAITLCLAPTMAAAIGPPGIAAQTATDGEQEAPKGPWFTKAMIDAGIQRVVRDIVRDHRMDEKQAQALSEQLSRRLPEFLKRQRPVLQRLVNEYLETVIIGDPPTPEKVAEWAQAVRPVAVAADKELAATYTELRPLLRPDQLKRWDGDYQKYRVAKAVALTEIGKLARGGFDPKTWHNPMPKPKPDLSLRPPPSVAVAEPVVAGEVVDTNGAATSGKRNQFKTRGNDGGPGAARFGQSRPPNDDVIVIGGAPRKLTAWESYVKQFIKKHDLDPGRENTALAILKDLREQAGTYEMRHQKELSQLTKAVADADPEVRPRLQAQLDELRKPIDDLFEELRSRLDGVLTESERGKEKGR